MSHEVRIVSLIASATEIACALGYERQLVGRSHECDFPPSIRHLPTCSEPRIDIHAGSLEIDRQVKQSLRDALSIYRVFHEQLAELRPSHILTQTQCEVCAVSLKDVEAALCHLVDSHPVIISHQPMDLADLWKDIETTAAVLGDPERGIQLTSMLQAQLRQIHENRQTVSPPSVFCLEWLEPMMSAGNWVPELVEIAGGKPVLGEAGKHSPYLSWESLLEADPDIIVIMPCGFDIPRTLSELPAITSHPEWSRLQAVQRGTVYVTDGNQYFNRPGPRLVDSAQILAEVIQDSCEMASDGYVQSSGVGWQRYSP